MDLTIHKHLAIGNGILTVENEEQAWVRAKQDGKIKVVLQLKLLYV